MKRFEDDLYKKDAKKKAIVIETSWGIGKSLAVIPSENRYKKED